MSNKILTTSVINDVYTDKISKCFDYNFSGESSFTCWNKPEILDEDFKIGLIIGSSGAGKSTLLKEFGTEEELIWDNSKSIASHFENPDDAIDRLSAVGLNSIPSWVKPYNVLSNGEKFRATLARRLHSNSVIDEFTSVVDRNVAMACCISISKYIENNNLKGLVFATCHKDIVNWINADWIFNCDTGEFIDRRSLRRDSIIKIDIYQSSYRDWRLFEKHHYLNNTINKASKCFIGVWNNQEVAFSANLCLPSKTPPLYINDTRIKFRESRLVVLPDFQGMGIGTRFSNAIGEIFLNNDYRYFSKTAHIRMGEYRQKSDLWRPTATNLKSREKSQKCSKQEAWHHLMLDTKRLCYSHEYLGSTENKYRILYEDYKKELK